VKLLRTVFTVWVALVALATGLALVRIALDGDVSFLQRWATWHPERLAPVGILTVGLVVLWALSWFVRDPSEEVVRLNTDYGHVDVTMSALRDYIQKTLERATGIEPVQCRVRAVQGRIHVRVTCRAATTLPVAEQGTRLQKRIRQALTDEIGLADVGNIVVKVVEFTPAEPAEPDSNRMVIGGYSG
jgi:uncharacterized alkaline shock family protein YloU